ncbi:TetR/AcrR family transcriptional regulator [Gordonia polyisoprenivorans]|uniref:TetR/AcrR family transcriptional regulator n=1 Tax=Gordonia polyisoprenivorans TaxID=84595 RepID=UPI000381BF86|nr:TetR/AcrR family transcriptional regulator [Gordonia polyisoprenivorans]QUD82915.1 TetR/AcrR family transcriptional regulator [Gordonia polyisoprenivorans]
MTAEDASARSGIRKTAGRPRDDSIDTAVLDAARELLAETGYAGVTVAAVAHRAGTTKTAIYRRWESKPHLVHDATFGRFTTLVPQSGRISEDVAQMVEEVCAVFGSPVTRAALPGLIADMAADPAVHQRVLAGFAGVFGGVAERLTDARERGELRVDVDPTIFVEMLGGAAILHILMHREDGLDEAWGAQMLAALSAIVVDEPPAQ